MGCRLQLKVNSPPTPSSNPPDVASRFRYRPDPLKDRGGIGNATASYASPGSPVSIIRRIQLRLHTLFHYRRRVFRLPVVYE